MYTAKYYKLAAKSTFFFDQNSFKNKPLKRPLLYLLLC